MSSEHKTPDASIVGTEAAATAAAQVWDARKTSIVGAEAAATAAAQVCSRWHHCAGHAPIL